MTLKSIMNYCTVYLLLCKTLNKGDCFSKLICNIKNKVIESPLMPKVTTTAQRNLPIIKWVKLKKLIFKQSYC